MTDEEKKAIEFIKSELQDEKVRVDYQSLSGLYGNLEIEILLNLIEKQSKEIEELKEDSCCMTNCVKRDKEKLFLEDKIKAKIKQNKELLDDCNDREIREILHNEIRILKEFLEE